MKSFLLLPNRSKTGNSFTAQSRTMIVVDAMLPTAANISDFW
jgi:hypothetical protein